MKISKYEENAIVEIHAWKNPELGWFEQIMKTINWPLDKAGDVIFKTPGVGEAITKSVEGLASVCNDFAQWSVRPDSIYAEYRNNGFKDINDSADIFELDLNNVDKTIGWLGAKYKSLALGEGALAGYVGLPGIPPDIVALITLNLRAIGEYATYCGFDVSSQQERLFAMNVLGLASSPSDASKSIAMAQLVRISRDVAKKRTWTELEKHTFVKIIQHIAKTLGYRLTKAKLAQVLPVAGTVVGGGFNAYFTMKVCDAAYYLYRERFLAEKHGPDIIEMTVRPADSFDPEYEDEQ